MGFLLGFILGIIFTLVITPLLIKWYIGKKLNDFTKRFLR